MKGSIERRGDKYRLIVSDGTGDNGKRRKFYKTLPKGTTESQSETLLARFLTEIQDGQKAKSGKMKLAELFEFWETNYAENNLEKSTLHFDKIVFARVTKALGHLRIDKIEPRHLLEFYKMCQQPGAKKHKTKKDGSTTKPPAGLSPRTIKKMHSLIHSIFEHAIKWNLVNHNPAARVDPPKVQKSEKFIYDSDTLATFLNLLQDEPVKYQSMVMIMLTAGLRREELFGLRWSDVKENVMTITNASVVIPGEVISKGTKTASSNRLATIPPTVVELLKAHRKKEVERQLALGERWKGSDYVFTTFDGSPAHPGSFNGWLIKFTTKHSLPHISPYSLRHSTGSILVDEGVSLPTVSKKLGHARISTTADVYLHTLRDVEQQTSAVMESFLKKTITVK